MILSPNDRHTLHWSACHEISQSHVDAQAEVNIRNAQPSVLETIFVGHLCRAMGAVARTWKTDLSVIKPGLGLTMASVFTHQTPMVIWNSGGTKHRCELSDVLLAIIDRTAQVPNGLAALIQAKLSPNSVVSLKPGSEQTQFDLLAKRQPFDVEPVSAPKRIDLRQPASELGLLYGVTGVNAPPAPVLFGSSHHWLTGGNLSASPMPYTVTARDCLAFTLVGMLIGSMGRSFQVAASGQDWHHFDAARPRDDWSTLVNYLLEETFAKVPSAAHGYSMGRSSRGQEDLLYLIGRSALGNEVNFWSQGLSGSLFEGLYMTQRPAADVEWAPHDPREFRAESDGGGSTGGRGNRADDEPPEGGAISAIVFEIGPRRE